MNIAPEVLRLAHEVARDMKEQGARAALLMGSQVRGDSYRESDVDLTFLGKDQECEMELRGGFLVSLYWRSLESMRELLKEPSEAGGLVPALRNAFIVWDPEGLGSQLKEEAHSWEWGSISEQCDSWVAEQIASYTEDVQRLAGHLRLGRLWVAAVLRNVISVRMGMILAVHLRIFYDSENRLLDLVNKEMGHHWTKVQAASLGVGNESFEDTCRATLELYSLAAAKVKHLMNKRQNEVVSHTCEVIGYPLG